MKVNQLFSQTDAVLEAGLNHRLAKQQVNAANIVNSSTPGYRAMGYEFESQLQAAIGRGDKLALNVTDAKHIRSEGVSAAGDVKADVHVKPTESIGNDGNTVDLDQEMSELAENQILYRSSIELLNRRLSMLRYGINGGR